MTNEEIVICIQDDNGDREELFTMLWKNNIKLTRDIIHRLTGLEDRKATDTQDFEDMEQQAFIGIMEAVYRFDRSRGIKFFSFAPHYITKSIYRYYDRSGQSLRVPAYMRRRIKLCMAARKEIEKSGGRLTDAEIMEKAGLSPAAYYSTVNAVQKMKTQSLDSYLQPDDAEGCSLLDMIASGENVEELGIMPVWEKELHETLVNALHTLKKSDQEIISMYFYQGYTAEAIAKVRKCSCQNVFSRMNEAYKKIRSGKYGRVLLSFLPERAITRAKKRIGLDTEDLTEDEKQFLA